ncbi:hypothetical protein Syun_019368 [Stephania yunnanensis]|uniref:Uncharacterized protein n=1 Tax=Stephania yunnanensis TaxID=152371 RepID=A0AAP0NZD0_9MAGN
MSKKPIAPSEKALLVSTWTGLFWPVHVDRFSSFGDALIAPSQKALSAHPHLLLPETDAENILCVGFGRGGFRWRETTDRAGRSKEQRQPSKEQRHQTRERRGGTSAEEGGRAAEQGGERTCGRGARSRAGRSAAGEHVGVTTDQGGGVIVGGEPEACGGREHRRLGEEKEEVR